MNFVVCNNKIIDENELKLTSTNRAFLYGDGFFESIKIFNSKIFNYHNHFNRIKLSANYLDINLNFSAEKLLQIISSLILKNDITNGSIRITIFRNSKGKYYPTENDSSYVITSKKDSNNIFKKSEEDFTIGLYVENLKPQSKISNLKSINSLLYVMAAKYARENNYNDVFLMNTNNKIIETTNSNIFILKKGIVFTPPLLDGCVDGSMRNLLMHIIKQHYQISIKSINEDDINNCEELILSNAISGVRRVTNFNKVVFKERKFYEFLISSLNKLI